MGVGDVSAQTIRTMEAVVEDDAVQTDPVMQHRLASATTLDRNQYTVVGRALQKHSHRRHSHFSAPPGGERAADYNREGARQLTESSATQARRESGITLASVQPSTSSTRTGVVLGSTEIPMHS